MKTDTRLMISDYVALGVALSRPRDRRWRVRPIAEAARCSRAVAGTGLNRLLAIHADSIADPRLHRMGLPSEQDELAAVLAHDLAANPSNGAAWWG